MKNLLTAAAWMVAGVFVLALAMHFRPPLSNPLNPEPFDPDLVGLQLEQAPRDAQILLLGDSIAERWRFRQEILANYFPHVPIANVGVGGSKTANLLWLVNSGKLAEFHPRLIVIFIGTNDLNPEEHPTFFHRRVASVAQIEEGEARIQAALHREWPEAKIIYAPPEGVIHYGPGMLAVDHLHMSNSGYFFWAHQMREQFTDPAN